MDDLHFLNWTSLKEPSKWCPEKAGNNLSQRQLVDIDRMTFMLQVAKGSTWFRIYRIYHKDKSGLTPLLEERLENYKIKAIRNVK